MKEPVVLFTGTSTIVAVKDVPKIHQRISIDYFPSGYKFCVWTYSEKEGNVFKSTKLPAGQYSILGWSDEISVEQMKVILPPPFIGVETYLWDFEKKFFSARSYTESYASFLTANNIGRELLLIKI